MNGDLGTDAGTVALNIGAKSLEKLFEALQKLLGAIREAIREHPQRQMLRQQLAQAKTREAKIELLKKYNGVTGEIALSKLEKYANTSNARLVPTTVTFASVEEQKRFSELAKSYGLMWAGVCDKKSPLVVQIYATDKDNSLLKSVLDRHQSELKIEAIDNKLAEIIGDKDISSLTEEQKITVECLKAEKEKIQSSFDRSFNAKEYNDFLDSVLNPQSKEQTQTAENSHGEKSDKVEPKQVGFNYEEFTTDTYGKADAFSASLDAKTGRNIDKDRNSIMVDCSEPDRYIECHGFSNPDKSSEQKIVTEYTVHRPDGQTKTFTDDKKVNDWATVKREMRDFGGFAKVGETAMFLRFNDKDEFARWQTLAKAQRENEDVRIVNDAELQGQIDKRLDELHSKGYEINGDGEVVRSSDKAKASELATVGRELEETYNESTSRAEVLQTRGGTLNATEAVIIGKEIANLKALQEVNGELAIAKTNEAVAEISGSEAEKVEAKEKTVELELKRDVLKVEQENIVTERNEINGLQAKVEQEVFDYKHDLMLDEKVKPLTEEIESTLGIPKEQFISDIQNFGGATRTSNLLTYARMVAEKANEMQNQGIDNRSVVGLEEKVVDLYRGEVAIQAERERQRTGGERDDVIYGTTSQKAENEQSDVASRTELLEDKQMSFEDGGVKSEIADRRENSPIGKNIDKGGAEMADKAKKATKDRAD